MYTKQVPCPVCAATHQVIARDAGVDCIACDKVKPAGTVRYFPGAFVKVLGAGTYVDEQPARVETERDKAQRLQAALDELRKLEEQDAAAAKQTELDNRLHEVEAQLAAKGKK